MREIKFRTWNAKENIMVDLYKITPLALSINTDGLFIPFHPDVILEQYTGLKDKNGKEIYEGDILRDGVGYILEVKFGNLPLLKSCNCVCTYPAFYCKQLGQAPSLECREIGDWMEIIGNIHENPELLASKTEV